MKLSKMDLEKIDFTKNRFLVDWFSFSSKVDSVESVMELLGMCDCRWEVNNCFLNGYTERYYFGGISIFCNGSSIFSGSEYEQKSKNVWVDMCGTGCRTFETYSSHNINSSTMWKNLFQHIVDGSEDYTVNRIDLAYDDFLGFLDIESIFEDTKALNFVSKFRSKPVVKISIDQKTGELGYTINHGSGLSDIQIRIYDKRIEQDAQEVCEHWVRNEIQLRHERAASAVALFCDEYEEHNATRKLVRTATDVSEVYFLIMNNYLRYIEPESSDSNKWRRPVAAHWEKFRNSVTEYRISIFDTPGVDYTQNNLNRYVEKQCSSAIYTYIQIHGVDKLIDVVQKKAPVLAPKYKSILALEDIDNNEVIDNILEQSSIGIKNSVDEQKKIYTCVFCNCKSYDSDFVSYNNSTNTGLCRRCLYSR